MKENILQKIFKANKPIIGALHFSPMLGYEGFTDKETILKKALSDLKAFEKGGVNGIIIENNYDLPHKIKVGAETIAMMTLFGCEIIKRTKLPVGVSVLWNDYKAALAIAKVIKAKFIRVPVFVDNVRTDFGEIYGDSRNVIEYRKSINAEKIALFTDIQVKHAEMLNKNKLLIVSAKQAIEAGSDCIILTGRWTGDAPNLEKLKKARNAVSDFPIILGSGVSKENVTELFEYADGAIVSTSLKEGENIVGERNVKPFQVSINLVKVKEFMKQLKKNDR
ncbi:MAG: BtpA/SgcQ family protein [bacterium]|nr:BtpA/SgcQ family protein [bacterium]